MTQQGKALPGRPDRGRARLSSLTRARVLFTVAALISLVVSVALWFGGDRERGLFVGLWVPAILSAGALYTSGERSHG